MGLDRRRASLPRLEDDRMNSLLVSIALALPMVGQPATRPARPKFDEKLPAIKLDGQWTVTFAEADGKKMEGTGFTEVTIKGNMVTCKHDGKQKSWRLEFGPHNMVRCTEMIDGKIAPALTQDKRDPTEKGYHTHHGVYIASSEYLCLCLNKGMDRQMSTTTERREERDAQSGTAPRFDEQGVRRAHFVLILHRNGSTPTSQSR
jgi:uncharacterized protein (TIGR03067 family)